MTQEIATLFSASAIGVRTVPNRFAALPMEANDALENGEPSPRTLERYLKLASGGWGVIYVEAIAPSRPASARIRQLVLDEKTLPAFSNFISELKAHARGAAVIVQLNHAGRYALEPVAVHGEPGNARILTTGDLDRIKDDMAALVELAARSGADGADLKICHGYLGVELVRPANTRDDSYGGAIENRTRVLRAMLEAAKPHAEKGFLIGSRISLFEDIPGGLGDDAPDESPLSADVEYIISLLEQHGASWVCETAGNPYEAPRLVRPVSKDTDRFSIAEMHHRLAARVKKAHPRLAVTGTGYTVYGDGFTQHAARNIEQGRADFIGFGRQNFADPLLPEKLRAGEKVQWCRACPEKSCSWLLRNRAEAGCIIHDPYYRAALKSALQGQGA